MVKTEKMITKNIKSKIFLSQQKNQKKNAKSSKKSYLVLCLILISSGVTKLGKKPLFKQERHQHLFHSSSFLFVVHATAAYVLLQKLIGI